MTKKSPNDAPAAARHDAWQAGDSYEAYMGRWSRLVAPRFLDWLDAPAGLDWLEVGCGTGALSAAILDRCAPASLVALDASEGFVATARASLADAQVTFRVGDAQALPLPDASRDAVVSALMLNFVPDRAKALAEMRRVVRPKTPGEHPAAAWSPSMSGTIPTAACSSCAPSGMPRRRSTPPPAGSPKTSASPSARPRA